MKGNEKKQTIILSSCCAACTLRISSSPLSTEDKKFRPFSLRKYLKIGISSLKRSSDCLLLVSIVEEYEDELDVQGSSNGREDIFCGEGNRSAECGVLMFIVSDTIFNFFSKMKKRSLVKRRETCKLGRCCVSDLSEQMNLRKVWIIMKSLSIIPFLIT